MKTILEYLNTNKMLEDPINVPKGLFPTYYIGLDRDFEIDIRTKIIEEVETIKDLERQLAEARYSATDYAMKLGRVNEELAEARGLLMHIQRRVHEVMRFVNQSKTT